MIYSAIQTPPREHDIVTVWILIYSDGPTGHVRASKFTAIPDADLVGMRLRIRAQIANLQPNKKKEGEVSAHLRILYKLKINKAHQARYETGGYELCFFHSLSLLQCSPSAHFLLSNPLNFSRPEFSLSFSNHFYFLILLI